MLYTGMRTYDSLLATHNSLLWRGGGMRTEEMEQFEEEERIEGGKETGRLEAFCDAVFAIAMTLLVLELRAPLPADLHGGSLLTALHHEWPVFLAFVTSFASILIMWVNHHNFMKQIKRVDHA